MNKVRNAATLLVLKIACRTVDSMVGVEIDKELIGRIQNLIDTIGNCGADRTDEIVDMINNLQDLLDDAQPETVTVNRAHLEHYIRSHSKESLLFNTPLTHPVKEEADSIIRILQHGRIKDY